MVRVFTALLGLLMLLSGAAQATVTKVTASVDKNPVVVNESFILTVTVNDDVNSDQYKPEQWFGDFIVGGTQISRKTSIINGEQSRLTTFRTVLIPQTAGTVTIPAITIHGSRSAPIELQVLAEGQAPAGIANRVAFVTASVDQQSVYVQQQLTYIAKLYLAADLNRGDLSAPQLNNADIRQIGRDEESTEIVDGRRYHVYQRTYVITPSESGTVEIKGARFNGEVYRSGQRSIFSSFSNTEPVSAIADDTTLQVKPIPNNWQGHWLPSDLVSLSRQVSPANKDINVGEPITVTFILTAVGVKPEQLPDINSQFPDSVQVYPDNTDTDHFTRNGTNIAQKTITLAVVPQQPGKLTLPEVKIPWFNTKTQQRNYAVVPAQTLNIVGDANAGSKYTPPTSTPSTDKTNAANPAAAMPVTIDKPQIVETTKLPAWLWLVIVIAAASLLLNLYLLWRGVRSKASTPQQATTASAQPSNAWKSLQKACKENNAEAAERALRQWVKQHYGQAAGSLLAIAQQFHDPRLEQQIQQLSAALYSVNKPRWNGGKALYQQLRQHLSESGKRKHQAHSDLPELYGEKSL